MTDPSPSQRLRALLSADPVPWILSSDEPAARWVVLTRVLGRHDDEAEVAATRAESVTHDLTRELLDRLPDWEDPGPLSGHDSPAFAPNLLGLLADMGVREDDDPRIRQILDRMLEHQDEEGRFCSRAEWKRLPEPVWGALLCDAHAIAETLARYGRVGDPRLKAAFAAIAGDLTDATQGRAWPCRPEPRTGFRGPGRKGDCCPHVTLEALRAFSYLPAARRPAGIPDAARVALRVWRERAVQKPYMFGHGRAFKRGKWPATWYSALAVLDAVGRYPDVWSPPGASGEDARAGAELAACLIGYAVDPATGTVTPKSCYKGFESHSFGQKKTASPFATAMVLAVLWRVADLADEIGRVDVAALGSSKGGSGTPMPA
jgi:hypothetical protein